MTEIKPSQFFYITDVDGNVTYESQALKRLGDGRPPAPKRSVGVKVWEKKPPTDAELNKLEDAIYSHEAPMKGDNMKFPYRFKFLNLIQTEEVNFQSEKAIDDFVEEFKDEGLSKSTLRHCWVTLRWRPSINGNSVFIPSKANTYY